MSHQSHSGEQVQVHTPGPWEACILDKPLSEVPAYVEKCIAASGGKDFYFVLAADDLDPADIAHVGNGSRAEANARLIAAAPDLLAVLQEVSDSELEMSDRGCINLLEKVRAAIARVTT